MISTNLNQVADENVNINGKIVIEWQETKRHKCYKKGNYRGYGINSWLKFHNVGIVSTTILLPPV